MDQRLSIWHTALQGILQHPLFGQGPVTYEMIYTQFSGYATHHAHNLILDTFLNYGVVGASLIGFFLLYQLRLVIRRIRRGISSSTGVLLLVMTFATFAHGMTDTTVMWLQTGLLFLLVYSRWGFVRRSPCRWFPPMQKGCFPFARSTTVKSIAKNKQKTAPENADCTWAQFFGVSSVSPFLGRRFYFCKICVNRGKRCKNDTNLMHLWCIIGNRRECEMIFRTSVFPKNSLFRYIH